jgi:hypothetical protein
VRRVEALIALAAAVCLIVAGLVWLLGPYGLIISGVAVAVLVLFGFDLADPGPEPGKERRGEPVAGPAGPLVRR